MGIISALKTLETTRHASDRDKWRRLRKLLERDRDKDADAVATLCEEVADGVPIAVLQAAIREHADLEQQMRQADEAKTAMLAAEAVHHEAENEYIRWKTRMETTSAAYIQAHASYLRFAGAQDLLNMLQLHLPHLFGVTDCTIPSTMLGRTLPPKTLAAYRAAGLTVQRLGDTPEAGHTRAAPGRTASR